MELEDFLIDITNRFSLTFNCMYELGKGGCYVLANEKTGVRAIVEYDLTEDPDNRRAIRRFDVSM